ncbi:MAG: hypothetical protein LBP59_17615 [Planctomycetaceae bacterium]|jgi:hypothetical protein|nr:hypothetical protein [Planctomycetaceae bacterium]
MKKIFSFTVVLALFALLAVGCCGSNSFEPPVPPEPPVTPDPPEPPVAETPQRYITLWGNNGDAGITITETPYQGVGVFDGSYESITRDQVADFYPDTSDEVLFPLDAEYYYWSNSDTDQSLFVTKWADGSTSYSLRPFGTPDNYEKKSGTVETSATEKVASFGTDSAAENYVQIMYYESPDLNRSDYEDDPNSDNTAFNLKSTTGAEQYL